MCETIQGRIDNRLENNKHLEPIPQVVCDQVKEKFGELRFYYHGGDEQIEGIVDMAETFIWNTCHNCGSHDDLETTKGWISRVCKNCKK